MQLLQRAQTKLFFSYDTIYIFIHKCKKYKMVALRSVHFFRAAKNYYCTTSTHWPLVRTAKSLLYIASACIPGR